MRVECVARRRSFAAYTYDLGVVADVYPKIHNPTAFDRMTTIQSIDAPVVFEALSEGRVVLASAESSFRLVRHGPFYQEVQATIRAIPADVVGRIRSVRVRWVVNR